MRFPAGDPGAGASFGALFSSKLLARVFLPGAAAVGRRRMAATNEPDRVHYGIVGRGLSSLMVCHARRGGHHGAW